MSPDAVEDLIRRVEEFSIDLGHPQLTFAGRLARENGWSASYAQRVIREYKRFAVLAVMAGHPVSPSGDVDQVWHLHLTYTRSYWDHFCREVLGTALHHDPTAGGATELNRHLHQYAQTLESYARVFGESPPADLWPAPAVQFGGAGKKRWIDATRYWIVPRLRFIKLQVLLGAGAVLATAGCGAAGLEEINPFHLNGPGFLIFYSCLLGMAGLFSLWADMFYLPGFREVSVEKIAEDPYLAAALAGGSPAVIKAALIRLVREKHLLITDPPGERKQPTEYALARIAPGAPLEQDRPEIEKALYEAVSRDGMASLKQIAEAGFPAAQPYSERLQKLELAEPAVEGWLPRKFPAMILVSVLLLGVVRIIIGAIRGKPVAFLIMLVGVGYAILMMTHPQRRKLSPLGVATRRKLLRHFKDLKKKVKDEPSSTAEITLAAGLFGTIAILKSPDLQVLADAMQREGMFQSSRSADFSSGCSGVGCGGDGGCGGGGCGGCGD